MQSLDELLEECGRLHGHMCAGQLLGARMAALGCRLIGGDDRDTIGLEHRGPARLDDAKRDQPSQARRQTARARAHMRSPKSTTISGSTAASCVTFASPSVGCASARARAESRGTHTRLDFPQTSETFAGRFVAGSGPLSLQQLHDIPVLDAVSQQFGVTLVEDDPEFVFQRQLRSL